MTINWRNDVLPSLPFIGFAGWLLYETTVLDVEVAGHVGGGMDAAGYPRVLALLIAGLSVLVIAQGIRRRQPLSAGKPLDAPPPGLHPVIRPALAMAAIVVYTFIMIPVGFLIATPVLLAFVMFLVGDRNWVRIGATAVLLTFATWAISFFGFHILLPEGWLGFFTD